MDRGFGRVVLFFVYLVPEMSPDSFKKHFRVIYFFRGRANKGLKGDHILHQRPRFLCSTPNASTQRPGVEETLCSIISNCENPIRNKTLEK